MKVVTLNTAHVNDIIVQLRKLQYMLATTTLLTVTYDPRAWKGSNIVLRLQSGNVGGGSGGSLKGPAT
jgi:hypothetical protein